MGRKHKPAFYNKTFSKCVELNILEYFRHADRQIWKNHPTYAGIARLEKAKITVVIAMHFAMNWVSGKVNT